MLAVTVFGLSEFEIDNNYLSVFHHHAVRTTEYAVPLGNLINVEEELAKLQEELKYQKGFLASVMKKLGNENFVSKAPAKVIEMEKKKQADAESKIKSIEESIAALTK